MLANNKPISIALLSGGLDSATATAMALEAGHNVIGISFDYGQRHKRELEAAIELAAHLNLLGHEIINVNLAKWGGSSLTDLQQSVPTQGIIKGKIPNTYVPGRNTVFIAIGLSLAEAKGANQIVLGINAMDYSGYPDCRPDYLKSFQALANLASKAGREGNAPKLWAPLIHLNKVEIIQEALRLNIPIDKTWSCYNGLEKPCGLCDSCRIRNEALEKAGRSDLSTREEI
ncbi:7-cyano-7-deazaguanine synthase QueC [Prochlorococcus marinus]|uniref:7-cyano-7-deazaguanine synthase n=1 Tax=Prochlorococcus marinus (strain MIT 9211) TaxID=93059 RepID=A9BDE2_PROM4|nr:7-cyano-7-deazaguanine synthase QueC [Prochlorococcus marinus]ABX09755.1 Predicted PP-loop superfamily ATPase [Prochlorococcus marinus str. MIT 9211]